MKLKSVLIIAALGIGVSVGTAGTVKISNVSGAPAALVGPGSSAPLAVGSVGIGTFGIDNDAIGDFAGPDGVDVAGLLGNFTQFADSVSVGFNGTAGLYETTISQALNAGDAFVGNKVYTVVGNATTLAGSSALLVVEDGGSFLADPSLMDAINLNGTKTVALGDYNADLSPYGGGALILAGTMIPEPSSVMLLLSGVALMVGRRRR